MKNPIQRGCMLEKRCFMLFESMGWNTRLVTQLNLSNDTRLIPDITLSYNNSIVGYVEIKSSFNFNNGYTRRFVEQLRYILNNIKPPVFFLTNGYVFDLYLEGEYFDQLTFVPSPQDIELLLKSKREGK